MEELAEALDAAESQVGRSWRAEAAIRRGACDWARAENMSASEAWRSAVDLASKAGDLKNEADALWRLGWFAGIARGELKIAQQYLEQGLALARKCRALDLEANCLAGLGWVFWSTATTIEDFTTVDAYFDQAREIYSVIGDRRGEAVSLCRRGLLFLGRGDLLQSRDYYKRALGIYREIGERPGEATPLEGLSQVCKGEDDWEAAGFYLEQRMSIHREAGNARVEAVDRYALGAALAGQGHYTQGQALCLQALNTFQEIGELRHQGHSLFELGLIHFYLGDYALALNYLNEARQHLESHGERFMQTGCLTALSMVSHASGDDETAGELAQAALENGPLAYHLGQGKATLALAHALAGLGDVDEAIASYLQSLDRLYRSGFINLPMEALAGLARVALDNGKQAQAMHHVEEILEHLKAHTLDGTYEPFRVYLTCYKVLKAIEDPRSLEVLRTACQLLRARAAGIEEEQLRQSFLEKVPYHRELLKECRLAGLVR